MPKIKDLSKYNEDTSKETTRPIYKKRYNKDGEEFLKKVDEIDIEEDLKEKQLEITRIKEIMNTQERLKAEELLDDLTNEEFLNDLENLQRFEELETYEFLNKTNELKEIYNKMPEEIRRKYNNNISRFTKEYLPNFIDNQRKKLQDLKVDENKEIKQTTNEELEKQIQELREKINAKENNENV